MYYVADDGYLLRLYELDNSSFTKSMQIVFPDVCNVIRNHRIPHYLVFDAKISTYDRFICLIVDDDEISFARLCGLTFFFEEDLLYNKQAQLVACHRNFLFDNGGSSH